MTHDNRLFTSKVRMLITIFLGTIVVNFALLIYLYINRIDFYIIAAIIVAVSMLGYIIILCFQYQFVLFSDEKDRVILRYYFIHPGIKKLYSIEIPKTLIANFKIRKKWFGIRRYLVLYQKTKNGIAEFPGVNINSLTKKETQNIIKAISKQLVINKVNKSNL